MSCCLVRHVIISNLANLALKLFLLFSGPGKSLITLLSPIDNIPFAAEIVGFILTIGSIYIIGMVVSNVIGKRLYGFFEAILSRIPFVSYVYKTIKQITETLSASQKDAFKKVVFIEYPRKGLWTLTMVTGESTNKQGEKFYHIFVPTTPNPTSGYMLYIPQKDTQETNMSIEEGLKVIISGGMLAPNKNQLELNDGINK